MKCKGFLTFDWTRDGNRVFLELAQRDYRRMSLDAVSIRTFGFSRFRGQLTTPSTSMSRAR